MFSQCSTSKHSEKVYVGKQRRGCCPKIGISTIGWKVAIPERKVLYSPTSSGTTFRNSTGLCVNHTKWKLKGRTIVADRFAVVHSFGLRRGKRRGSDCLVEATNSQYNRITTIRELHNLPRPGDDQHTRLEAPKVAMILPHQTIRHSPEVTVHPCQKETKWKGGKGGKLEKGGKRRYRHYGSLRKDK